VQAYEVMILIDPEAEEARQEEIIARVRDIVLGAGGTWDAVDPWGRRKLAYEILRKPEAFYWMVRLTCPPSALAELERVLRITDDVLRHKAVVQAKVRPVPAPAPAAARA
jgi:small subunit ribosomal protein S6